MSRKESAGKGGNANPGNAWGALGVVICVIALTSATRGGFRPVTLLGSLIAIAAGILILLWPQLIRWFLASCLIVVALSWLVPSFPWRL
jgi:hypothetical protein